jgi:hypothetical protein
VNAKIAIFNRRATELCKAVLAGEIGATEINPATDKLLELLFADNPVETQDKALQRLRTQFTIEYSSIQKKSKANADAYIAALLTLETAAGLGTRDEMTIYGITSDDSTLASSELFAFAGFFDRRYREHDYDIGRTRAQSFLDNPGDLGPINYTKEAIHPIDTSLNGLKLENMNRDLRIAIRDRLRDRSHEILREIGVNPWLIGGAVREAIDLALIKPQLDKLLKL